MVPGQPLCRVRDRGRAFESKVRLHFFPERHYDIVLLLDESMRNLRLYCTRAHWLEYHMHHIFPPYMNSLTHSQESLFLGRMLEKR